MKETTLKPGKLASSIITVEIFSNGHVQLARRHICNTCHGLLVGSWQLNVINDLLGLVSSRHLSCTCTEPNRDYFCRDCGAGVHVRDNQGHLNCMNCRFWSYDDNDFGRWGSWQVYEKQQRINPVLLSMCGYEPGNLEGFQPNQELGVVGRYARGDTLELYFEGTNMAGWEWLGHAWVTINDYKG